MSILKQKYSINKYYSEEDESDSQSSSSSFSAEDSDLQVYNHQRIKM